MKRSILTIALTAIALLAIFTTAAFALSPADAPDPDTLIAANQLYEAGHYAEAAQMYQQLAEQGVEDSTLFYNLGNAQYQQGNVLQAIINYQHAAQLAPRDADIQANLELALSQSPLPMPAAAFGRISAIANATDSWLTVNELALLALGLWFTLAFLIIAWRTMQPSMARKILRYATVFTLILVIASVIALGSRIAVDGAQQVIFTLEPQLADVLTPGT
jgi:tetratricopeptide (TPR) repeat protein